MTLTSKIRKSLINDPSCRNNDFALCFAIWLSECNDMDVDFHNITTTEMFIMLQQGKLSKQQTILRTRRKLNFKEVETIGASYKPTKNRRTKVIKIRSDENLLCTPFELNRIKSMLPKKPIGEWRKDFWRGDSKKSVLK